MALATAVTTSEWKDELARHYWSPAYLDGAALRHFLDREREEMRAALRDLGLLHPSEG